MVLCHRPRYMRAMVPFVLADSAPRLGAHMSIAGGLYRALERGADAGCEVVQIFTSSNQQWRARLLTDRDVHCWQEARQRTGVFPAMVHSSYLLNLGSPDRALWRKSLVALADEYARCLRLEIPYLVLHPGAHMGSGETAAVKRIARALDRL